MPTLTERAASLAREHRAAGTAPFGDLGDEGSALLLAALGETSETTGANWDERFAALDAYAVSLIGPVALTAAEAAEFPGEVINLAWDDRADYDE